MSLAGWIRTRTAWAKIGLLLVFGFVIGAMVETMWIWLHMLWSTDPKIMLGVIALVVAISIGPDIVTSIFGRAVGWLRRQAGMAEKPQEEMKARPVVGWQVQTPIALMLGLAVWVVFQLWRYGRFDRYMRVLGWT